MLLEAALAYKSIIILVQNYSHKITIYTLKAEIAIHCVQST